MNQSCVGAGGGRWAELVELHLLPSLLTLSVGHPRVSLSCVPTLSSPPPSCSG